MNRFVFALRMLRRDMRSGELRVLVVALAVAVASVTSVGFFTDRIQQALQQQANELLAADLVISADHEIPASYRELAQQLGLTGVNILRFRTMVFSETADSNLAEIKVIEAGYPLRGQLKLADAPLAAEYESRGIPESGHIWVEAGLLRHLDVQMGAVISLGASEFTIAKIITYEPDRSGGFFSIAPRIMFNAMDLPATRLVQKGSRVRYEYLLSGPSKQIQLYRKQLEPQLQRGEHISDVTDSRKEVRQALNRSNQFLGLAALVSVMLAGVAVAMATRRHVVRHLDSCAIMRCVGAKQSDITSVYTWEMIFLGLLASVFGCVIGYFAHSVLIELLASLFLTSLPAPSFWPVVYGLFTGMVTLLGFAVPPLLHLKNVPTLRVLRRELGMLKTPTVAVYAIAMVALCLLLLLQARDLKLGLYMLGGLLGTVFVLVILAMAAVRLLRKFMGGRAGSAWRFGLANVARRSRSSVLQILAFGIGIMALMILALVRNELLVGWQQRLPEDTPNRFIINIQKDQLPAMEEFFKQRALPVPATYPMVRGRLTHINGKPVASANYDDEQTKRLVEREFNLSWASELQEDNQIKAGVWWPANTTTAQFSMEEDIAFHLGVKVGDNLTYHIGGENLSAEVTSIRKVQWDSFRANFFVLAPPGVLEPYSASYITSFYLPKQHQAILADLVRQFPNFTIIDVSAIMEKVRSIILRVTDAVEYVFLFTLVAGLMVLYAAIQASHDERVRESAIIRTLGASRVQLLTGLVTEFVLIGMLAGLVAAIAASVISYVVAEQVLQIPFQFNGWMWLLGLVGGGIGVGLAGFAGTRGILHRPPLQTLGRAEN